MGDSFRHFGIVIAAALLLLACAISCQPSPTKKTAGARPGSPLQPKVDSKARAAPNQGVPIVEFWDTGSELANGTPTLFFAAWADGQVIRQVGNRLYVGDVPVSEIHVLIERLGSAGVDRAPFPVGAVGQGRATQVLWVNIGGQPIRLLHDTSVGLNELDQLVPQGAPSRAQAEEFVQIWSRVVTAIDDVWPIKLEQIQDLVNVPYPGSP